MKMTDLTGKRYGTLVVMRREGTYISPKGAKAVTWRCKCDCGNETVVQAASLRGGTIRSCGCKHFVHPFNAIREKDNQTYIKVKDQEVIIDTEDFSLIYPSRVYIGKNGYAYMGKHTPIHRLVMNCKDGMMIDHINHNRLDNRKCNLRIVTASENGMNKKPTSNTGEIGISHRKDGWYMVYVDKKYCGIRKTLEEAIELRNEALKGTKQEKLNYYFAK